MRKIPAISIYKDPYPVKRTFLIIKTKKFGNIVWVFTKFEPYRCFYISPNEQVWASTLYIGPDRGQRIKAHIRKELLGHNYDVVANANLVQAIETCVCVNKDWFLREFEDKNKGTRRY